MRRGRGQQRRGLAGAGAKEGDEKWGCEVREEWRNGGWRGYREAVFGC